MPPSDDIDRPTELLFLSSAGCRSCDEGREVLQELAETRQLTIREVGLLSDEGRRLVNEGRVPFPPAVFLGDHLLGHGRLSARALARELEAQLRPLTSAAP